MHKAEGSFCSFALLTGGRYNLSQGALLTIKGEEELMSEKVNPDEELGGSAEISPNPETSGEAGAEVNPISEPSAETQVEKETEAVPGAAVSSSPEATPEAASLEPVEVEAGRGGTEPTPPEAPLAPAAAAPLSASDERTWAMLAHLSVLANLVTGVLGPFIALIIYLVYRDRSRYVAYQSMQAFIFQLITWVGSGILIGGMWLIVGLLSIVVIGVFLIPFAVIATICLGILPLVGLIYGIVGAIETSQGKDFKYWLVGDWARSLL
jgi:uncharacterized protein